MRSLHPTPRGVATTGVAVAESVGTGVLAVEAVAVAATAAGAIPVVAASSASVDPLHAITTAASMISPTRRTIPLLKLSGT
jgi:hypothetical protein